MKRNKSNHLEVTTEWEADDFAAQLEARRRGWGFCYRHHTATDDRGHKMDRHREPTVYTAHLPRTQ